MSQTVLRLLTILRIATSMMLVVLGVVNVALIVGILVGQREIRSARTRYGVSTAAHSAKFVGIDVNGRSLSASVGGPGTIVWFGSEQCPYCKTDREMPRLVATLQKKGWQTIVLLPSYDQLFAPEQLGLSNVHMVPFVSGEWLKQFPLVVTPTLLMFDGEQRLIWYYRGRLTASDSMQALRVAGISRFDVAMESPTNDVAGRTP